MKLMQCNFLIAVLLLFGTVKMNAQSGSYITINDATVITDSVFVNDSVAPGNRMLYTAGFDIVLNSGEHTKSVVNDVQSALQKGVIPFITISIVDNINGKISERVYKNAAVIDMQFCGLDAQSKVSARIKVRIRSSVMNENEESSKKINVESKGAKPLLASNYKIEYGGLPTQRTVKVSSMQIGNQSQMIYLEMSVADVKTWYQRLTGGSKKEKAVITLLSVNMTDKVMEIKLDDAEVVSFSRSINNDNRIARFIVGFRTRSVFFENK